MYLLILILSLFLPLISAQNVASEKFTEQNPNQNFLAPVIPVIQLQNLIREYMQGYETIISEPNQHYQDAVFAWDISCLALLKKSDGNQLPSIIVYNLIDKTHFKLDSQNQTKFHMIALSSDGTLFAAGDPVIKSADSQSCESWNIADKKDLGSLNSLGVDAMASSPNDAYCAIGGHKVYLYNNKERKSNIIQYLSTLPVGGAINIIAFSPDSSLVAFTSLAHHNIYIVKTDDHSQIHTITLKPSDSIRNIGISADNKYIGIIKNDVKDKIVIWDITARELVRTLPNSSRARSIAMHPTKPHIATISPDKERTVDIWDIASGKLLKSITIEKQESQVPASTDFKLSDFTFDLDVQNMQKNVEQSNIEYNHIFSDFEFNDITFSPNGHYLFINSPSAGYIRGISNDNCYVKMDIPHTSNAIVKIAANWKYLVVLSPFKVIKIDVPYSPVDTLISQIMHRI